MPISYAGICPGNYALIATTTKEKRKKHQKKNVYQNTSLTKYIYIFLNMFIIFLMCGFNLEGNLDYAPEAITQSMQAWNIKTCGGIEELWFGDLMPRTPRYIPHHRGRCGKMTGNPINDIRFTIGITNEVITDYFCDIADIAGYYPTNRISHDVAYVMYPTFNPDTFVEPKDRMQEQQWALQQRRADIHQIISLNATIFNKAPHESRIAYSEYQSIKDAYPDLYKSFDIIKKALGATNMMVAHPGKKRTIINKSKTSVTLHSRSQINTSSLVNVELGKKVTNKWIITPIYQEPVNTKNIRQDSTIVHAQQNGTYDIELFGRYLDNHDKTPIRIIGEPIYREAHNYASSTLPVANHTAYVIPIHKRRLNIFANIAYKMCPRQNYGPHLYFVIPPMEEENSDTTTIIKSIEANNEDEDIEDIAQPDFYKASIAESSISYNIDDDEASEILNNIALISTKIKTIYTIGAEGNDAHQIITKLKERNVRKVIDIRKQTEINNHDTPNQNIQELLVLDDIGYKALDITNVKSNKAPEDYRHHATNDNYQKLLDKLNTPHSRYNLEMIKNYPHNICILAKLKDWKQCGRRCIADILTTNNSTVIHIHENQDQLHKVRDMIPQAFVSTRATKGTISNPKKDSDSSWPPIIEDNVRNMLAQKSSTTICAAHICEDGHLSSSCQLCRQIQIKARYHKRLKIAKLPKGITEKSNKCAYDLISLHYGKTTICLAMTMVIEEWYKNQKFTWRLVNIMKEKTTPELRRAMYHLLAVAKNFLGIDIYRAHGDRERGMVPLRDEFRRSIAIELTFCQGQDPVGLAESNNRILIDYSKKAITHLENGITRRWAWEHALQYTSHVLNAQTARKLPEERRSKVKIYDKELLPFGSLVIAAGRPKIKIDKVSSKGITGIFIGIEEGNSGTYRVIPATEKYLPMSNKVKLNTNNIQLTTNMSLICDKYEGKDRIILPHIIDPGLVKLQHAFFKCSACGIEHQLNAITANKERKRLENTIKHPGYTTLCYHFKDRICHQDVGGLSHMKRGKIQHIANVVTKPNTTKITEFDIRLRTCSLYIPFESEKDLYLAWKDICYDMNDFSITLFARYLDSHDKIELFIEGLRALIDGNARAMSHIKSSKEKDHNFDANDIVQEIIEQYRYWPHYIDMLGNKLHNSYVSNNYSSEELLKMAKWQELEYFTGHDITDFECNKWLKGTALITRHADKTESKTKLASTSRKKEMKDLVDKNTIKGYVKLDSIIQEIEDRANQTHEPSRDMICWGMILTSIKNAEILEEEMIKRFGEDWRKSCPQDADNINTIYEEVFKVIAEEQKNVPEASQKIPKFKARYVMRGDKVIRPQAGEDFREKINKMINDHGYAQNVTSAVTSQRGLRFTCAIALITDAEVESADLEQFFVQEEWPVKQDKIGEGRLFMRLTVQEMRELPTHLQPPEDEDWNEYLYTVDKCLYGHELSCRLASMGLTRKLTKMGFKKLRSEYALFVGWDPKGEMVISIVYVDDICVVGSKEGRTWFWKELRTRYRIPETGLMTRYVGTNCTFIRDKKWARAYFDQHEYAAEIIRSYHEKMDTKAFPLVPPEKRNTCKVTKHDTRPDRMTKVKIDEKNTSNTKVQDIQEILGMYGWYTGCVRPDIMFTVRALQQRCHCWDKTCDHTLAELTSYVGKTKYGGFVMHFSLDEGRLRVVIFTDSDLHAPKSQSGGLMAIIGPGGTFIPLEFTSQKQKPVSNSTPMSEVISAAGFIQAQLLFATEIQQILDVIQGRVDKKLWDRLDPQQIPMFVDAKEIKRQGHQPAKMSIQTITTKLNRDQLLWLTESLMLSLIYLNTKWNPSDIGTKQHDSIDTLRKLNNVVLDCEDDIKKKDWVPTTEATALIKMLFEEINQLNGTAKITGIDHSIRVCWEIDEPQ